MSEYRYLSPEKVYLELNLAGVGARFAACFIDSVITGVLAAFVFLVFFLLRSTIPKNLLSGLWVAIALLVIVIILYGYPIFFETVWNGQTPGKRLIKIRVVQESGAAVTFGMVLIRNLLRLIDVLPVFYAVGMLAVMISRKNQRLGDMAAGTVVIREISEEAPAALKREGIDPPGVGLPAAKTLRVEEADFAVLKKYLLRREGMKPEEIQAMDRKLADFFGRKLGLDPDESGSPVEFLRQVAAAASQETTE